MTTIAVLGAGSWGVALARLLDQNGHDVRLWEYDPQLADILREDRELKFKLPGVKLSESIGLTSDLAEAVLHADVVVFATPAAFVRETCRSVAAGRLDARCIVCVAKGLECDTQKPMHEVVAEELGPRHADCFAVLSGPSHAEEVGRDLPTTVVVASDSDDVARMVQETFMNARFRVYRSHDVLGVEIGGAVKNVIAIAGGISDGLGFGDNAKAGLVTRGLAEITRLGVAMGAEPATFAGLSGLGDLVVTCCSAHSRNYRLGRLLAEGKTLAAALDSIGMVVEGVYTATSAAALGERHGVEMPITAEVAAVLFKGKSPRQATRDLMLREAKHEMERM